MVAVKTGFSSPSMPGMPAPMQPMMPMGGPGTFPVPQGGNPFAPLPPMPLAGSPPPMGGPGTFPVAPNIQAPQRQPQQQQGSNANRRRKFGDSLEGMLGRNQGLGATAPQQRPLPMPQQQQRMVAPGVPMMRTPPMGRGMPRPMQMGGEVDIFGYEDGGPVQYMSGGGSAKPNIKEFMDATGVSFQQASQALHGSVGSNKDIRNWDAIMASDNPLQAAQAATSQMYSSGSAIAGDQRFYDEAGNYSPTAAGYGGVDVGASTGGPKLQIANGQVYITGSDGLPLTGLTAANAASFGITQNQIDAAIEAGGNISGDVSNAGYVPYDAGNLLVDYSGSGFNPNSGGSSGSNNAGSGFNNAVSNNAVSSSDQSNLGNQASVVRQTGDVGSFSRGLEGAALFGPSIDTAPVFSQYVQNPTTGAITTTAGPTMTSVSPIGSIDLPAAPVDIDIYDYLSDPVFGSMDTPIEKNMGGAVPRQTSIAGQPHGLAYINQDEEALLRSFGGSGIAGPGGIPSYPPTGVTSSGGASDVSTSFDSGYGDDDDDDNSSSSSDKMSFGDDDYTPTSDELNQQLSDSGQTNITSNTSNVNYDTTGSGSDYDTAAQADTDVSGAEFVALGGLGSGDSGTSTAVPGVSLGSTEALTTYSDMLGNTHSSAADRDRANLGIQQQMYGSGNQAARNVQQELYRQYAERFPEGKQMEGDSEELGRMSADTYLKYAPQINELLGPQGLPNQPFNLPFSFSGIEGITPRGSDTAPDAPDRDTTSAEYKPQTLTLGDKPVIRQTIGLPSEQDIGLGPGGTGNQFNLPTGGPGTFGSTGLPPAPPAPPSPAPDFVTGTSGGGSSTDPNQFPVEKIQSMFNNNDKDNDKDKDKPTKQITEYTDKDGNTTVDNPKTPQNEAMLAQLGLTESLASGRDIGVPNAAESAFLMEALGQMEFNDDGKLVGAEPNFFEETVNKIIKNLTLGALDPNDPQKREDALAILDNYEKTGTFVYDTENLTPAQIAERLKAQGEKGLEPAVIGVEGADKTTVGFDDGTGFRNIMGDYDYEKGIGSDTQNILTGDTDVFGGNTNNTATTITTGGGDDDDGSDSGGDVDTGHTVDEDGNKVCNTEGYVYNPETKICEPKKETDDDDKDLTIDVVRGEDFDDVLSRVTTASPNIGSIAGNVENKQEGGMVGLNRAADNFLQALAG